MTQNAATSAATEMRPALANHLLHIGTWADFREWAEDKPSAQVWEQCDRPDWLLFWAARTERNSKDRIAQLAIAIADTVSHLARLDDDDDDSDEAYNQRSVAMYARGAMGAAKDIQSGHWRLEATDMPSKVLYVMAEVARAECADHHSTSNQCDLIRSVLRQPWSEYD